MFSRTQGGFRLVAVFLTLLLAVTMIPAAGMQPAFADEPAERPATAGGDVALEGAGSADVSVAPAATEGLAYSVADGKATLVGFQEGAVLEGAVVVPESVDGATVVAVEIAEGQVADKVTSLTLPQTVESVRTEGLASAFPSLASIEVDGTAGTYSTSGGMLFLQGKDAASSDGSTTLAKNRELVWAPPALVVARLPIECKSIAPGAFVDAAALETVMCPGVMESIAVAEKDDEDNVIVPGAFTDEQIASLSIVVPGTNIASPSGDRVSASVALSEDEGMEAKREAWWKHGFDSDKIVMGTSFGEVEGVVAVSDEGVAENPSIDILKPYEKKELAQAAESGDEEAAARLAAPEGSGLSFSYNADMNLSVSWAGDKTAMPASIEIPAYVAIDGVKYAVTEVAPEAFKGAVFLTSVTIPEGVRVVGESAFEGCSNLKEVSLPSTLRTIDYAAFKGCTALENVEIPVSVTWIGGEAFGESEVNVKSNLNDLATSQAVSFGDSDNFTADNPGVSSYAAVGYRSAGISLNNPEAKTSGYAPLRSISGGCVSRDLHRSGKDFKREYMSLDDVVSLSYDEDHNNNYFHTVWWAESASQYTEFIGVYYDAEQPDTFYIAFNSHTTGVSEGQYFRYTIDPSVIGGHVLDKIRFECGGYLVPASVTSNDQANAGKSDTGAYCIRSILGTNWYTEIGVDPNGVVVPSGKELSAIVTPVVLKTYQLSYDGVDSEIAPSKNTFTVEDPDKHLVDPAANARPGYKFLGWTGPGNPDTPKLGSEFEIDVAGVTGEELTYTAHWEPVSTATFNTGTGQHFDNVSYYKGDAPDLPVAQRTGFWFAGWYPTTGAGWWDGKQDGRTLYNGKMPADAQGDVTFNAVWTPKTYTVRYDTEASRDAGGNRVVDQPQNKTFVHPTAANSINQATGLTFGVGADGTVATDLNVVDNHYFDLTNVKQSWCTDYALDVPEKKLGAYPFVGWCKIDDLAIGTVPGPSEGGNQRYWTELREKDADGAFTDTNYFFAIFGEGWSDFNKDQCATPYTVYGVWGSTDETTINLKATQPSRLDNLGEQVVTAGTAAAGDKLGSATRGTESIRFRENHGFIGQAAASDDSAAEALHTGTPERRGAGYEIDAAMNLKAPVRYGFQFLGWGAPSGAAGSGLAADEGGAQVASTTDVADVEGKLYIAYDEDAARAAGKTGFTLTGAGAALVASDDAAGTHAYTGSSDYDAAAKTDGWSAYWRTRTVDVTLRIPSHAVADVDFTGDSTKAGHPKDADHPYNTKADYTFTWTDDEGSHTWEYAWREGSAGETGGGATAGWYITDKRWSYYDVLEYPAFDTQRDRYTYDGWYEMIKSSTTDSTDKALADLEAAGSPAMRTPIATYENLVQPNTRVRVTGLPEGQGGLTIDENYFLTGQGKDDAGEASRTLWLWTSPIRINVASPVGVYLCTTNSYGQAVDPFVVGNDRRTQLEAQAEFQVSTGSHDLQLVGVTAEDVTAFGYQTDEDGNVVRTDDGANAPVVDAESVESGDAMPGMADKILNPKFTDAVGSKETAVKYGDETSRMFWVSPVPTATADQTGVVYGSANSTAADEAAKVPGSGSFGADEGALVPDVEKRRYFGFGYKAGGAGDSDNRIEDQLDSSSTSDKEYALGDFVLRRHDNYEAGEKDGLALVKHDADSGASTYRFYYGLDMRRCDFDLAGLQDIIDNSRGTLAYNSTFDQPLLRVKFTFAAARNDGISYFSARGADEGAQATGIPEDTVITVGAAS